MKLTLILLCSALLAQEPKPGINENITTPPKIKTEVIKLTDKQRADYFKHRSAADNLAKLIAQNEVIQTSLKTQLNEMERSLIQEQMVLCGEKAKFEVTKEGEPECKSK